MSRFWYTHSKKPVEKEENLLLPVCTRPVVYEEAINNKIFRSSQRTSKNPNFAVGDFVSDTCDFNICGLDLLLPSAGLRRAPSHMHGIPFSFRL